MKFVSANLAQTTITGTISNAATAVQLASAASFPTITPGSTYFVATLNDGVQSPEIVWVTNVVGNTATIVRSQEGTTANSWNVNSFFSNLITAGQMNLLLQPADLIPAGVMFPFAGPSANVPSGYLICYGQSVLRTDYPALFTAIGSTYGAIDGTHFTIPDLRGRVVAGIDNMGGGAASRLTATSMSPNGNTLGATGGAQTETGTAVSVSGTVSVDEVGVSLNGTITNATGVAGGVGSSLAALGDPVNVNGNIHATGSNTLTGTVTGNVETVQPTLLMNMIIKT